MKKALYLITVTSSALYIIWRVFFTLPYSSGLIPLTAGILLVFSEAAGMFEALLSYYGMQNKLLPKKPEILPEQYPHVDVFIATYNEPSKLLFKTVNGCLNMDYPDKKKVHIYLCDDSNREEIKALAVRMGVGYITRNENTDAKAGNLNHAMSVTDSPLIATLDADMIPRHNFLLKTVPYFFIQGEKIGFIQAPQNFYNADLFQFNLFSEKKVPNEQDFFFKDIQIARNKTNSPIYGGSNTVLSRKALEECGGFYTGVITEDFATGIEIQAKGYTCYAIGDIIASGLAPTDLKSLMKQRERWARGCIQTFRRINILFHRGLSSAQKLSYFSSFLYWYTPLRRLMYIASPVLFSAFGMLLVECSLSELLLLWLPANLLYAYTLKKLSGNIRNTRLSNIYDTILFPTLLPSVLCETLGIRKVKFSVTAKERRKDGILEKIKYAAPHFILTLFTIWGLVLSTNRLVEEKSLGTLIILYWLIVNLYHLLMSTFFMIGRRAYRNYERFEASLPILIRSGKRSYRGISSDISESGISILLNFPEYIPEEEKVEIFIYGERMSCRLQAHIITAKRREEDWKYSFAFTDISQEEHGKLCTIVYDRIPSFPKQVEKNTGFFQDFYENIKHRIRPKKNYGHKLAKIPMNLEVQMENGERNLLKDFSYEYITLKNPSGEFAEKIKLKVRGDTFLIGKLTADMGKRRREGVYRILNPEVMYKDKELRKIICVTCSIAKYRFL